MLKIRRNANGDVVLTISGSLRADNVDELSGQLGAERAQRGLVLDLKDLVTVDGDAIRFLCACEREGIVLRNCPRYVSAWMARERERP
jgi:anti-anti-sigma regulatory factor